MVDVWIGKMIQNVLLFCSDLFGFLVHVSVSCGLSFSSQYFLPIFHIRISILDFSIRQQNTISLGFVNFNVRYTVLHRIVHVI